MLVNFIYSNLPDPKMFRGYEIHIHDRWHGGDRGGGYPSLL